ncbi:hypothetical protein [Maribellus maritimus]|uniref:hypothetical protein n=1 Tax=Maribellus maritimus TaxID=2870838 RepID=UPI001EEA9380|nr:hypothetical protein [Maribellus maritimus]MCG6191515.1 hypothetical protein [Maribellus maritimus]
METIIQKTGKILYVLNRKGKRLLSTRVLRNHTSVILFIMLVCLVTFLTIFWGLGYRASRVIVYTSAALTALFVALIFIGSWHEARRLRQNEIISCFLFKRGNINGIQLQDLGFSDSDCGNLNLILNNLAPKHKIDFKLVSDNRAAADYKKLFRILHLLIDGGIRDFKKERKEMLFKFIESTFTLNGSEVNRASLNSRFSEWVNESKTEFSENLDPFRKILGQ